MLVCVCVWCFWVRRQFSVSPKGKCCGVRVEIVRECGNGQGFWAWSSVLYFSFALVVLVIAEAGRLGAKNPNKRICAMFKIKVKHM